MVIDLQSLKTHDGVIGSSASRKILFVGGLDFAVKEFAAVGLCEHVKTYSASVEGVLCGFLWLGELDMSDVHVREDTGDHFGAELGVMHDFAEQEVISEGEVFPAKFRRECEFKVSESHGITCI